jgi:small subunit ribosomal protein S5
MTTQEKENKQKTGEKVITKSANSTSKPKSVYAAKRGKGRKTFKKAKRNDEFAQEIVDLARVTRVMAGGKRMRFRACVAVGDRKGKVAIGLAKGADVSLAINKAVNVAKKEFTNVSIVNSTIPHEVFEKYGAAKVLLKPAAKGRGVIAGGAVRIILELAGISNITSKNLGTNNKVSVAKCTISALGKLKKVEKKKTDAKKNNNKKQIKKGAVKDKVSKVKKTALKK